MVELEACKVALHAALPGEADAFQRLAFKRYQDHGRYLAMERDFARRYLEKIAR